MSAYLHPKSDLWFESLYWSCRWSNSRFSKLVRSILEQPFAQNGELLQLHVLSFGRFEEEGSYVDAIK
jgi:hypothetical protein